MRACSTRSCLSSPISTLSSNGPNRNDRPCTRCCRAVRIVRRNASIAVFQRVDVIPILSRLRHSRRENDTRSAHADRLTEAAASCDATSTLSMETPEILKMAEMAEILSKWQKWQKWQKSSQNGILTGHHQTSSARKSRRFHTVAHRIHDLRHPRVIVYLGSGHQVFRGLDATPDFKPIQVETMPKSKSFSSSSCGILYKRRFRGWTTPSTRRRPRV
jgi:hypothetical protein